MQQWSASQLQGVASLRRDNASVVLHESTSTAYVFGGCDEKGSATNTLFRLNLAELPESVWQVVECKGDIPQPRWGHSSFIFGNQLWVYGGAGGSDSSELYCLNLRTVTWRQAHQTGSKPDRSWLNSKQRSFSSAVVAGNNLLAFGKAPQDENTEPIGAALGRLQLHAYDISTSTWSVMYTSDSIRFAHLEHMLAQDGKLLCVGWSAPPRGTKADCHLQVCCLDVDQQTCRTPFATSPIPRRTPGALIASPTARSLRSRTEPSWIHMPVRGVIPTARIGSAAAVLGNQLILHGGMLCSPNVQGVLIADTFCLNLASKVWTKLQPAHEKGIANDSVHVPRVRHVALAIPAVKAVLLLGGTSSRHSYASCTAVECLRQVQPSNLTQRQPAQPVPAPHLKHVMPQVKPTAPATSQQAATAAAAGGGIADMLSGTPTLLGIQPFEQLYTPSLSQSTPALHLTPSGAVAVPDATPANDMLTPVYDFSSYCCNEALSDVELLAGGTCFPAHRLLLCQSYKLRHMLSQACNSPNRPSLQCRRSLHLDDVFPDVLKLMLHYMYGCLTVIPVDLAPLLFTASNRYMLPGLHAACLLVLTSSITLDNITAYALLAHQHNCGELTQACVAYAAASSERFQQMLATPGYLHLNQTHPKVGQMFVQMAMQYLTAKH